MKYLILTLSFLCVNVFAQESAMQTECERQMALGICSVQTDARKYKPNAKVIIGKRRVAIETYLYVKSGDKAMCTIVERACLADSNSDVCFVGKAVWGN